MPSHRTQMDISPAQRDFLRALAYQSDRPMKAVLDDALLLLEDTISSAWHDDPPTATIKLIRERYQEKKANGR